MDIKLATRTLILAFAGNLLALPALAQWQWIDKDGRKVFSDRAPPAEIPGTSILKQPAGTISGTLPGAVTATASPPLPASAPVKTASAPKLSVRDAELEVRKKQADDLDKAKKEEEAEKIAKASTDNCERAKKGQSTLKSGVRIAVTNATGEREFMDDAARAAETRRLQAIAESDCAR